MNAVYFVVDRHYKRIAEALALLLVEVASCDVHLFVEDDTIDAASLRSPHHRVFFHVNRLMPRLPPGLPASAKWPPVVYLRLFVPELLPGYRRFLYLDADIYITESIDPLWSLPLPNRLAAVHDVGMISDRIPGTTLGKQDWLARVGLDGARYFNSGALLFDADALPASRETVSVLKDYYQRFGEYARMFDQDFLNYLFKGGWDELSPRWNYQAALFGLGFDEWADPVALHFTDGLKPWHARYDADRPQLSVLYRDLLARTDPDPAEAVGKPYRPGVFTRLRQSIRRGATRWGHQTGREHRLRRAALARRDRYLAFFIEAVRAGRYIDWQRPPFAREPQFDFDGRHLIPDQTYVMDKVAPSTGRTGPASGGA